MAKTLSEFWNSWTDEQREVFVLKNCGSNTPMERIEAAVESVSAYSLLRNKTKKAFILYINEN